MAPKVRFEGNAQGGPKMAVSRKKTRIHLVRTAQVATTIALSKHGEDLSAQGEPPFACFGSLSIRSISYIRAKLLKQAHAIARLPADLGAMPHPSYQPERLSVRLLMRVARRAHALLPGA